MKNTAFIDRDLSWMYFNHRILQEAQRPSVPLLERIGFLGIYSNNLDEFFRVRVASLHRLLRCESLSPPQREQLTQTAQQIYALNAQYSREYAASIDQVFAELASKHSIHLLCETELTAEQSEFLLHFFDQHLAGNVWPRWFSGQENLRSLSDKGIYLVVSMRHQSTHQPAAAIVQVPDKLCGRFVHLPSADGKECHIYTDDVLRHCLPRLFRPLPYEHFQAYAFKVTKDAEMDLEHWAELDWVEQIERGLHSRGSGKAIRLLYDQNMPTTLQTQIAQCLKIKDSHSLMPSGRYQNHKDLMGFLAGQHPELRYPPRKAFAQKAFNNESSILAKIGEKDRWLHVPYHSFDDYLRLLHEAALSPEVCCIKTTLYRVAKNSKVAQALIAAARNGKKVVVVVELLARFDEAHNIKWSKRLQEAGVTVRYGVAGLKVHSKLLWIESTQRKVACIGTGNFHEGNAKVYTDYFMLTARPELVDEVERVFAFIERPYLHMDFTTLLVSPHHMKQPLLQLIETEIAQAQAGREAWIKIKINHITDRDLIAALCRAALAGVCIRILLRGNCALALAQWQEAHPMHAQNLQIRGIIDRYLEHERLLIFAHGGETQYFLGSADWMPRNLERRVEVMGRVFDPDLQADLLRSFDLGWRDTQQARLVDGQGSNQLHSTPKGGLPLASQTALYEAYQAENPNEQ